MKIGILTYFGDLNFGTNLQAYTTLKSVRKIFPQANVEIVPIHSFHNVNRPYFSSATPISIWRDLVRIRKYRHFVKKRLEVDDDIIIKDTSEGLKFINSHNYDRIYVGSDTILELDRHVQAGHDDLSFYWLGHKVKAKQFLLAASSKNVAYETITPTQKVQLEECVSNYSGIYVRDMPTKNLIGKFIDSKNVKIIPDPTFAYDIDYKYADDYVERRKLDLTNAILVHGYREDFYIPEFVKKVKEKGFKVVSLRPSRWADIEINDMGPEEQAGIFKYFKCVITHRFHDTVFCLKNNTPVAVSLPMPNLANEKGESKHSTLLDYFGLTDLCLTNNKFSLTSETLIQKMEKIMNLWDKDIVAKELNVLGGTYLEAIKETL